MLRMDENPYDILGVSRTASMEEVKKAYRKKARENHPDLNPDDPEAEERLKKVNEAYDRIMNPEKYVASDARRRGYGAPYSPGYNGYGRPGGNPGAGYQGTGSPGAGYNDPYQWTYINIEDFFRNVAANEQAPIHPEASGTDSAEVRQAIAYINASQWKEALGILKNIPTAEHNARWYYLYAIANDGAGNTAVASDSIRRAREMDPANQDYLRAQAKFTHAARNYTQQAKGRGFTTVGIDPSALCCTFMCCCPALMNTARYCGLYGL